MKLTIAKLLPFPISSLTPWCSYITCKSFGWTRSWRQSHIYSSACSPVACSPIHMPSCFPAHPFACQWRKPTMEWNQHSQHALTVSRISISNSISNKQSHLNTYPCLCQPQHQSKTCWQCILSQLVSPVILVITQMFKTTKYSYLLNNTLFMSINHLTAK